MKTVHDLANLPPRLDSVVTVGVFDGVHLGHQALIRGLVARARLLSAQAALITFHPHPSEVLRPTDSDGQTGLRVPRYLTTPAERSAILEELGIDLLAILPFTRRTADTQAVDFLSLVCDALRMRELWVGPQFALGHDRQGDTRTLDNLGRVMGFSLRVVEPLITAGEIVTSSRIRRLLLLGRIREAARLLGRFYSLSGEVVHGEHRGRRLGFPTANLEVQADRIMPPDGVYAGYAWVGGNRHGTVMSLGVRPTFGDYERLLEIHLLDCNGDLYGRDLTVEFVERLRPEVKFDSVQALIEQIQQDKGQAQAILTAEAEGF